MYWLDIIEIWINFVSNLGLFSIQLRPFWHHHVPFRSHVEPFESHHKWLGIFSYSLRAYGGYLGSFEMHLRLFWSHLGTISRHLVTIEIWESYRNILESSITLWVSRFLIGDSSGTTFESFGTFWETSRTILGVNWY